MLVLDAAGATLPEGLRFFTLGWWVIHLLAVVLVYAYGYRKGRRDERRAREGAGQESKPDRGGPYSTTR